MIGRRLFSALLVGGAVMLTLSGCGERHNLRYKMTVEVETPQGVKITVTVYLTPKLCQPPLPHICSCALRQFADT
jgi:hypothetical protein